MIVICYASYRCVTACLVWTWTHCHNKGRYAWSWSETPRVSSCCSCLCLPCHNDYSSTFPPSQHNGWKSESSAQDLQELKRNNYDQTSCLIIMQLLFIHYIHIKSIHIYSYFIWIILQLSPYCVSPLTVSLCDKHEYYLIVYFRYSKYTVPLVWK